MGNYKRVIGDLGDCFRLDVVVGRNNEDQYNEVGHGCITGAQHILPFLGNLDQSQSGNPSPITGNVSIRLSVRLLGQRKKTSSAMVQRRNTSGLKMPLEEKNTHLLTPTTIVDPRFYSQSKLRCSENYIDDFVYRDNSFKRSMFETVKSSCLARTA